MSQSEHNSIKIEEQDYKEHGDDDGLYDSPNQINAEEQQLQQIGQNGQPQLIKKRTHRKLQISNFIMKTYKILQDKKNSDIVEWTDEGNCFIVKNKQKFSNQILPKYFKHNKFSSFVRQLNMYDFHKIRKQKQIPIFKHKYFKMGFMQLLHKIKRKSGEQGKQQDSIAKGINISKQNLNLSQQLIGQGVIHPVSFKNKQSSCHNSLQSDIDILKKQNMDLQHSISQMTHQINELQEKKKQKLVKIVTSLMFFVNQPKQCENTLTLRQLQDHFMKEEQPFSFTQYTEKLSSLYSSLQHNLL